MIAIARAETTARRTAGTLAFFRAITKPFTLGLAELSNMIVRLFGVDPGDIGEKHTAEDVQAIISETSQGGRLDPGEAVMLSGVFHLHEQEAREMMTPIPAVVTVDADETVADALQRCVSTGHTRLVVIEDGNPDRVRGIVHNNSLIRLYLNAGATRRSSPRSATPMSFPRPSRSTTCSPSCSRCGSRWGSSSTSTAGRSASSRRGHPRGDRRRDRGRDRRPGGLDPPALRRRLLRPRPRLARRPRRPGHRAAGRHRRLQLDRRLCLLRARPRPAAWRPVQADGYTIRVESVRDNRIVAVRIARTATRPPPRERLTHLFCAASSG